MAEDDAFDAGLIASELVTNAVRHGAALPSGHLVVEWTIDSNSYTILVTDGGTNAEIAPRAASEHDITGRGLTIVAALAQDWGVCITSGGTTVWARGSFPGADALNRQGLQTTS
jgi:two-component sensor histidine kinase